LTWNMLDVIRELGEDGMTMLIARHELESVRLR
jgi:ABC-type polar amino acid transport system ATPase subunit